MLNVICILFSTALFVICQSDGFMAFGAAPFTFDYQFAARFLRGSFGIYRSYSEGIPRKTTDKQEAIPPGQGFEKKHFVLNTGTFYFDENRCFFSHLSKNS